uniref:Cysteine/serine-rich nuclear protein N-terminal domain-containing protein n=1 Tax=Panagrolaimus sp. ES5 TaxID=591445 RepID=A0AC34F8J1_9BILA
MNNPLTATSSDVLKAKREKLLLARTAPVENSDEKIDILPMPIRQNSQESVVNKRKRMTISKSECSSIKNELTDNLILNPWKSMDSVNNNNNGTPTLCLPSRTSRRISEKDKKNKKSVKFGGVAVYYFGRNQSYSAVPSTEGVSLGMEDKHHSSKTYSFYEFARATTRQNERKWAEIRQLLEEQKKPRRSPRKKASIKSIMSHTVENEITKTVQETLASLLDQVVENEKNHSTESDLSDPEVEAIIAAESDSEDDDEVFPIPEAEIPQPLEKHVRHAILEQSNIPLDFSDDSDCQEIRKSRTKCGCSCLNGLCVPETCECSLNGIKCQVDLQGFPCVCAKETCSNLEGRVEFNPLRVRSHYLTTLKILNDMEKMNYEHTSSHPRHIKFVDESDDESGTSTSYLSTPPPPIYQRQTTVQLTTDLSCDSAKTTTTVNTSANSIIIAQSVNNNNNTSVNDNNSFSQSEIKASVMETPPQKQSFINQEKSGVLKRKYPVTPTYARLREDAVYE